MIVDNDPVRSCLLFAVQCQGVPIRTVEGLAGERWHPLQTAFRQHHALQCGFCTPGFLMLAAAVLEQQPDLEPDRLRGVLSSNLCRCTGYTTIVDAVTAAATAMRDER